MFKNLLAPVLACALMLSACSALKLSVPTESYQATVCADGIVKLECTNLGVVKVPAGGQAFVATVLALAGPLLEKQANLKGCQFTTYPESVDGNVVVTATAVCKLNGLPVQEFVTVTLAPV
jgi:hypothetical protein